MDGESVRSSQKQTEFFIQIATAMTISSAGILILREHDDFDTEQTLLYALGFVMTVFSACCIVLNPLYHDQ